MHIASSPTGTLNLDWTLDQIGFDLGAADRHKLVESALLTAARSDDPYYLPFLGGEHRNPDRSGAFVGLRPWHDRATMVRAVAEGVSLNHRTHLAALRSRFGPLDLVRLCGGGTRSRAWSQMMADVVDARIQVADAEHAGARGAALMAAVGVQRAEGFDGDLEATPSAGHPSLGLDPDPERVTHYEGRYLRHVELSEALAAVGA